MKKVVSLFLCVLTLSSLLVGCGGAKDVDSRDEANRVLLSAISVIAECEKTLDEYEKDLYVVDVEDLDAVEKRLNNCNSDIEACDSYKDIEGVSAQYDSATDKYERAVKHLKQLREDLEEYEEEKK